MGKTIRVLIMAISEWLKQKAAIISLAMAGVEKNALGQKGDSLETTIGQERRHSQGKLSDSLKQGEVTQEVMNLRWRMYKILQAADGNKTEIVDYDKDGMPITKTVKVDKTKGLNKVKLDNFDNYPLEMVVDNSEISSGGTDAMHNNFLKVYEEAKKYINENGDEVATHGEIKAEEYFASNKPDLPIKVGRMFIPKFNIEDYTKKLNVRVINETDRLLEFYISMYPDVDNRKTNLLISDIKKAIENPLSGTFLEIKEVGFITYKTVGVQDFLEYQYDIASLDKIVQFNGHYVIKYLAKVKVNGKDIFEQHKVDELEEKYKNKEAKKNRP